MECMNKIRTGLDLIVLRAMVVTVLVFLAGCAGQQHVGDDDASQVEAEAGNEAGRFVEVEVREIVPARFLEHLELTGTLEPHKEVQITSENGGAIREIRFEKGDRVKKGDLLCRVGDDLAEARLDQAVAELMAAEANFLKVTKLFERQAVPQQDLVAATAQRDRLKAALRERELILERARLKAPIDGIVLDRPVETGEVIPAGARVTTLQSMDRLKAATAVPDTEIRWLKRGSRGLLRVDAWPERSFPVSISFVSPAADPDSRSFPVELALDNTEGALRPGMVARIQLQRRLVEDAIAVPLDALITRVEGPAAYVVEECVAVLRYVRIGATEGNTVLVEDGLQPGDLLVVAGQRDLVNGQEVRTGDCR
jgi:membrane fusion protein (multidrug efflux system)